MTHAAPAINHVLIVGSAGSGTTLIESYLGAHPDIAMLDEDKNLSLLRLVGKKMTGTKLCIPNQIQLSRRFRIFGSRDEKVGISAAVVTMFWRFGIGGKLPQSPFSIEDLINRLPGLKIVAIIRQRQSAISSMVNRSHDIPRFADRRKHAAWRYDVAEAAITELVRRKKCCIVEYEALCENPSEVLLGVCGYLEIDFREEMLRGPEFNFRYPSRI